MPSKETHVVGTTFAGPTATSKILQLVPGAAMELKREPGNKHDRNAVAVYVNQSRVGYVPRSVAASVAKIIDGKEHRVSAVRSRDRSSCKMTITWVRIEGDPLA